VKASNPFGDSGWSEVKSVVVQPPPPQPPVLYDIANEDGDGNYTVIWSAVSGATNYSLQEDDEPSFAAAKMVYSGTDTSKSIDGRDAGTYYYRVNASNSAGTSDWSNVESVVVSVPGCVGPLPGRWHGSGEDFTFDFTVSDDSSQVTDQSASMKCGPTGADFTNAFASSITDGEFSSGFGGANVGGTIRGTFVSSTEVTGTWSGWAYPYTCGGDWTGAPE
jgi:hypothetical protein